MRITEDREGTRIKLRRREGRRLLRLAIGQPLN